MSANSAFNVTGSATGTGTVTSIAIASGDSHLAITGSPITNSGTITLTFNTLPVAVGATGITTYNQGDIIFASAANTLAALAKNTTATRYLANTGSNNGPNWDQINLTNGVSGFLPIGNIVSAPSSSTTQYLRGDGTWAVPPGGGGSVTGVTATTPLASSGGAAPVISVGSVIPLNLGGTDAALTASNGGLVYSTASALAILSGTATANQVPLSGSNTTPIWSTATYLPALVANEIVYASSINTMAQIPTMNSATLVTDSSGVPSLSQMLPGAVQVGVNSLNNGTGASSTTFFAGDGSWKTPAGASTTNLGGRLSLTSGVPVTTTDVLAATTIYFVPYKGGSLTSQVSVAVPATTLTVYDIFYTISSNTLSLLAWTNQTTRATALAYSGSTLVLSGTPTSIYLGTFMTTSVSGQTQDASSGRYLWNYYNRVQRTMVRVETAASWLYTSTTWRQANANTLNQINFVCGVVEDAINVTVIGAAATSGTVAGGVGVGINSTSINSSTNWGSNFFGTIYLNTPARYDGSAYGVGLNYMAWLEATDGGGSVTWVGTAISIGPFVSELGISGTLLM